MPLIRWVSERESASNNSQFFYVRRNFNYFFSFCITFVGIVLSGLFVLVPFEFLRRRIIIDAIYKAHRRYILLYSNRHCTISIVSIPWPFSGFFFFSFFPFIQFIASFHPSLALTIATHHIADTWTQCRHTHTPPAKWNFIHRAPPLPW